jgi:hypothetical protein
MRTKLLLVFLFCLTLLLCGTYIAVFGRALRQKENHLAIALRVPKALLSDHAVPVGEKYLAKDSASFITAMALNEFMFVEQMGAGYFFEKNGVKFVASGQMYSRYLMIFTEPAAHPLGSR